VAVQVECVCPHIASGPSERTYNETKSFVLLGKLGLKMGVTGGEPQMRADRLNSDELNCVVVLRSADTVPDHAV